MDGPDSFHHFWEDLRRELELTLKHQNKGAIVMIWAEMSSIGLTAVAFVESNMNSAKYCKVLEKFLLTFANNKTNRDFFQQDNAPFHKFTMSLSWLLCKGIKPIKWPAQFPNLKPIENLRSIIAKYVYFNGRWLILTKEDLMSENDNFCDKITVGTIDGLLISMQKHCTNVLKKKGCHIDY